MADELIYILNDDNQNYPILYIQIIGWNVWTLNFMNQPIKIRWKSQKLLGQQIRKRYYKSLST